MTKTVQHPATEARCRVARQRLIEARDIFNRGKAAMWGGMLVGWFSDEELAMLADELSLADVLFLRRAGRRVKWPLEMRQRFKKRGNAWAL